MSAEVIAWTYMGVFLVLMGLVRLLCWIHDQLQVSTTSNRASSAKRTLSYTDSYYTIENGRVRRKVWIGTHADYANRANGKIWGSYEDAVKANGGVLDRDDTEGSHNHSFGHDCELQGNVLSQNPYCTHVLNVRGSCSPRSCPNTEYLKGAKA